MVKPPSQNQWGRWGSMALRAEPLSNDPLFICLRILARRGRVIREAAGVAARQPAGDSTDGRQDVTDSAPAADEDKEA
jgi:hypothetical protein